MRYRVLDLNSASGPDWFQCFLHAVRVSGSISKSIVVARTPTTAAAASGLHDGSLAINTPRHLQ